MAQIVESCFDRNGLLPGRGKTTYSQYRLPYRALFHDVVFALGRDFDYPVFFRKVGIIQDSEHQGPHLDRGDQLQPLSLATTFLPGLCPGVYAADTVPPEFYIGLPIRLVKQPIH